MFQFIILNIVIINCLDFIDLTTIKCNCYQTLTKDDCLRFNCKVSPLVTTAQKINIAKNTLKNKTALAMKVQDYKCTALFCSDIKTQLICDNTGECVWNNNGVCEVFSGCGSYSVANKTDCLLKSTITKFCTYPDSNDSTGNYTCINDLSKSGGNFMTCFTLNSESNCNNYESATCTWRTFSQCEGEDEVNSCQQYQYCIGEQSKDCSDLFDKTRCSGRPAYCRWDNNTCIERECADYTTEITCKHIVTDDLKRAKPCTWEEGSCVQGFNLTKLNKYNCLIDSLNTSVWNEIEQRCQSCQYGIILSILIINLLI